MDISALDPHAPMVPWNCGTRWRLPLFTRGFNMNVPVPQWRGSWHGAYKCIDPNLLPVVQTFVFFPTFLRYIQEIPLMICDLYNIQIHYWAPGILSLHQWWEISGRFDIFSQSYWPCLDNDAFTGKMKKEHENWMVCSPKFPGHTKQNLGNSLLVWRCLKSFLVNGEAK